MHFTRAVEENGLYSWSDHTAAKRGGGDGGQQPVQEHLYPAEQNLLLPVQLEETSEVRHTVSNSVQCSDIQYLMSSVALRLILMIQEQLNSCGEVGTGLALDKHQSF